MHSMQFNILVHGILYFWCVYKGIHRFFTKFKGVTTFKVGAHFMQSKKQNLPALA